MSKRKIIKRARDAEKARLEVETAQEVAEPPKGQSEASRGIGALGAVDADDFADKVANAVCARLERFLPICARLAAADTLHTMEGQPKVLNRAIDEGIAAADLIRAKMEGQINGK